MTDKPSKSAKATTRSTGPKEPAGKAPSRRKRTAEAPEPTHDEIAERAYHIYLNESGGDPLAHWLRAKGELTNS
jgi:hypothetical protein